jgi:hypothetical protein
MTVRSLRVSLRLALSLALTCAGCEEAPIVDAGSVPHDAGTVDSGAADAGAPPVDAGAMPFDAGGPRTDAAGAPDAGSDSGATTIAFTAPSASVVYARGTVRLQLVTLGPDPDRVELWKDGAILVVLPQPYTYDWLSDDEAEGEHVFEARALLGGVVVGSAERRFTIDRQPPRLIDATPASSATDTALGTPIVLTFSEPLAPTTVDDASVLLEVGGTPLAHTRLLSPDGTTIELRITAAPTLPATAIVTATTGITDPAGNALEAATHSVLFPAWVTLVPPITVPGGLYMIELEIDGAGLVWLLVRELGTESHVLMRWDGGLLGTPVPVADGGLSRFARLRLDSANRPVVAYYDGSSGHIDTFDPSSGTWSAHPPVPGGFGDVEIGPGDVPYIARAPASSTSEVLTLQDGVWTRIGDAFTGTMVDLAVDSAGIHVGFMSALSGGDAYLGTYSVSSVRWFMTEMCSYFSGSQSCPDANVVAHGASTVRGLVTTTQVIGGSTSSRLRILVAPSWGAADATLMSGGASFGPAAATPTGYVVVIYGTTNSVVRDETGQTWPIASNEGPTDVDAHEDRLLLVGPRGLRTPNAL